MTTTTIFSCAAMFAFAIGGLTLLFYLLYQHKFGAAAVTAICLVLGTCAVVVRPSRQQETRAPEPASAAPAPAVPAPSPGQVPAPPTAAMAETSTETAASTGSPTTTSAVATETQVADAKRDVQTSTAETAARRRAIARFLLDPKTQLFHEPTCPAAKGLTTKASPSVASMQGYRPHTCVRNE